MSLSKNERRLKDLLEDQRVFSHLLNPGLHPVSLRVVKDESEYFQGLSPDLF